MKKAFIIAVAAIALAGSSYYLGMSRAASRAARPRLAVKAAADAAVAQAASRVVAAFPEAAAASVAADAVR